MSNRTALIVLVAMMSCVRVALAVDPADNATLKMAPKGVSLIAHVEGKPAGEMFQRLLKVVATDKEFPAEIPNGFSAIADMASKIDSIDAYVGTDHKHILFAVHSKLTVEELVDLAGKFMKAANPNDTRSELKAAKGDNGRYTVSVGPMPLLQAVNGKEADDVKDDVILVGMNGMMDSMIATLNSGPSDTLKELAKKADLSAPVWAIVDMAEMMDKDDMAPKTIVVSAYPDGKKASISVMNFATNEAAESMEKHYKTVTSTTQPSLSPDNPFLSLVDIKRKDAEVTAVVTLDDKLMNSAAKALKRARQLAMRAVSLSNVHIICNGLIMYSVDTVEAVFPENLYALIGKGYVPAQAFVSPVKQRKLKVDDKGIPTEDGDYIYIKPLSDSDDSDNVVIYEPLENWNGEGTVVGCRDWTVKWMSAEDFKKAMKKTMDNRAKDKK